MLLNSPVRVGVIGAGGMGGLHANNLAGLAGVHVTAVMDTDPARAAALAREVGAEPLADGLAVVNAPTVDAVVVASPNETHPALVLAALGAGKPVLCEKPLALDRRDAEAIVAAEVAAGRRLVQVGFMRRYDPRHTDLARRLHAGEAGTIALIRGWHRSIGGDFVMAPDHALRSAMVHDFDSLSWLAGEIPVSVACRTALAGGPGAGWTADFLDVGLVFPSGALGRVEFHARSAAGYEVGVEVTGSHGTLRTGSPEGAVRGTSEGSTTGVDHHWFTRFAEAYRLQAGAWVAGVRAGGSAGPSAWDALVSLAVADAALVSVETGATVPVHLPERRPLYA